METTVDLNIKDLEKRAKQVRLNALEMIAYAGSGHPAPSLSCADIIAALYFKVLNIHPWDPKWPDRDRFIMSKGHGAPALYAALALTGFFPEDFLHTFRRVGGGLQGHPDMKTTPGLEMTSGALGNGLSIGAGMAIAALATGKSFRTYVLLGDGECQEGQVWEAAMAASTRHLSNLIAIVDRNTFNQTACTECSAALEPFKEKWEAFNWRAREIDGHSMVELLDAFDWAARSEDQPSIIIATTVKGKGVSFIEGKPEWHAKALTNDEMNQARRELSEER